MYLNSLLRQLSRLAVGVAAMTLAGSVIAGGLPNVNPKTTIRYIDNYGSYAVVHYNKDVPNDAENVGVNGCMGAGDYALPDSTKIRSFVVDYTTAEGKALFVHLLAVAAARKKTTIWASSCDGTLGTGLPVVDSIDTRF